MILVPSGVRVWLAIGRTDMRRGMNGLALFGRRPIARAQLSHGRHPKPCTFRSFDARRSYVGCGGQFRTCPPITNP